MTHKLTLALAAAALALVPAGVLAQSASPAPTTSSPPVTSSSSAPSPMQSAAPAMTMAPAPSTSAPSPATGGNSAHPTAAPASKGRSNGKHLGQIKKLKAGTLSTSDLRYALTHPTVEFGKVRKMKSISFDKLRVYKLSSNLKSLLKVGDANDDLPFLALLSPSVEVAQTNGSNSPIADLQYVLANINVSNALNNVNVLNNSNVNVGVTLADVLNGNKISIGQVAGIFVDGLGVITTITK